MTETPRDPFAPDPTPNPAPDPVPPPAPPVPDPSPDPVPPPYDPPPVEPPTPVDPPEPAEPEREKSAGREGPRQPIVRAVLSAYACAGCAAFAEAQATGTAIAISGPDTRAFGRHAVYRDGVTADNRMRRRIPGTL